MAMVLINALQNQDPPFGIRLYEGYQRISWRPSVTRNVELMSQGMQVLVTCSV